MKRLLILLAFILLMAVGISSFLPSTVLRQILSGTVGLYMHSRGFSLTKPEEYPRLRYWSNRHETQKSAPQREAVVLLHGAGGDEVSTWFTLMPALSRDCTVFAPHLPYANLASNAEFLFNFPKEIAALRALLQHEGLTKVHLVGMSAGAWMAGLFTARYPERVKSLVMISPMGTDNEIILEPLVQRRISGREFARMIFHSPPPLLGLYAGALGAEVEKSMKALNNAYSTEMIRRMDLEAQAGKIRCPVLVLWGEHDAIIPQQVPEKLASMFADAKLETVAESGHAMVWDAPEQLEAHIRQFWTAQQ